MRRTLQYSCLFVCFFFFCYGTVSVGLFFFSYEECPYGVRISHAVPRKLGTTIRVVVRGGPDSVLKSGVSTVRFFWHFPVCSRWWVRPRELHIVSNAFDFCWNWDRDGGKRARQALYCATPVAKHNRALFHGPTLMIGEKHRPLKKCLEMLACVCAHVCVCVFVFVTFCHTFAAYSGPAVKACLVWCTEKRGRTNTFESLRCQPPARN